MKRRPSEASDGKQRNSRSRMGTSGYKMGQRGYSATLQFFEGVLEVGHNKSGI